MTAPLDALAEGPEGTALWLTAQDGTRLRAALWPAQTPRGTVFLIPGRTEYVEKYGRTARALTAGGYTTLSLDLRGQGLSDRKGRRPLLGHVADFAEYQQDIDALLAFAEAEGLPRPFHLLSHSMGGTIALRALLRGLPFQRAAFSAPMWGIQMPAWQKPLALPLSATARALGLGQLYAPGTGPQNYLDTAPFDGNTLTTDPETWGHMTRQSRALPALALGGPSLTWLYAALTECRALSRLPSPAIPTITALGTHERIVDPAPILTRMAQWPQGRLHLIDGAEHEILMETPPRRQAFLTEVLALFG